MSMQEQIDALKAVIQAHDEAFRTVAARIFAADLAVKFLLGLFRDMMGEDEVTDQVYIFLAAVTRAGADDPNGPMAIALEPLRSLLRV